MTGYISKSLDKCVLPQLPKVPLELASISVTFFLAIILDCGPQNIIDNQRWALKLQKVESPSVRACGFPTDADTNFSIIILALLKVEVGGKRMYKHSF